MVFKTAACSCENQFGALFLIILRASREYIWPRHWIEVLQKQHKFYFIRCRLWYTYSNPKYGNCFTFNTMDNIKNDGQVPRQASLIGRFNGENLVHFLKPICQISCHLAHAFFTMIYLPKMNFHKRNEIQRLHE